MRDIDPNFDPALHTLTDSSYFEDMSVGQRFVIPSRTIGDANFAAFQLASGDNHPIHYDVEYCREKGHPHMLAHGFQIAIQTAPGAGMLPHVLEESLIGLIEQSSKFLVSGILWRYSLSCTRNKRADSRKDNRRDCLEQLQCTINTVSW